VELLLARRTCDAEAPQIHDTFRLRSDAHSRYSQLTRVASAASPAVREFVGLRSERLPPQTSRTSRNGLVGNLAYDRNVQTTADHAGDVLERHPLFDNRVIASSFPLALVRSPAQLSLPNEILAWAGLVSDHRAIRPRQPTQELKEGIRSSGEVSSS
jgi:hypothetical protein